MKNLHLKLKKYLPDIILIIGVVILTYNWSKPDFISRKLPILPNIGHYTNATEWRMFGIVLIVIAIDIAIRQYLKNKNK